MLERIGDSSMPSLLIELAIANGCGKTRNKFYDRCRMVYRNTLPDQDKAVSRLSRPAMRGRPALPMRSPSPIFRSGMSSSVSAGGAAMTAG
jgi:hypothetical protein